MHAARQRAMPEIYICSGECIQRVGRPCHASRRIHREIVRGRKLHPQRFQTRSARQQLVTLPRDQYSANKDVQFQPQRLVGENFPHRHPPWRQPIEIEQTRIGMQFDLRALHISRSGVRNEGFRDPFQKSIFFHAQSLPALRRRSRPRPIHPARGRTAKRQPGTLSHFHMQIQEIPIEKSRGRIHNALHQTPLVHMRFAKMDRRTEALPRDIGNSVRAPVATQVQMAGQRIPGYGRRVTHTNKYSRLNHSRRSSLPFSDLRSANRNGRSPRCCFASLAITSKSAPT